MAESITVGELLLRIRADVNQLDAGLRKAQGQITTFSTVGAMQTKRLEFAFRTLGLQAVGLSGPLGRIASILSGFGGMKATVALGALGAIAVAWKLIADRAKAAREEMEKAADALRDRAQIVARSVRELVGQAAGMAAGEDTPFLSLLEQLTATQTVLQERLDKAAPLGKLLGIFPDTEMVRTLREQLQQLANALNQVFDAWERAGRGVSPVAGRGELGALKPSVLGPGSLGDVIALPNMDRIQARLQSIMEALPARLRAAKEVQDSWRRFGETLGSWMASGLMSVFEGNFKGFLKSLLASVLSGLFSFGLGSLYGGAGAVAGFGSQVRRVGKGAMPNANFSMAARDAGVQRFFREMALVAGSQGFRP